jgi:hypothetical protein
MSTAPWKHAWPEKVVPLPSGWRVVRLGPDWVSEEPIAALVYEITWTCPRQQCAGARGRPCDWEREHVYNYDSALWKPLWAAGYAMVGDAMRIDDEQTFRLLGPGQVLDNDEVAEERAERTAWEATRAAQAARPRVVP